MVASDFDPRASREAQALDALLGDAAQREAARARLESDPKGAQALGRMDARLARARAELEAQSGLSRSREQLLVTRILAATTRRSPRPLESVRSAPAAGSRRFQRLARVAAVLVATLGALAYLLPEAGPEPEVAELARLVRTAPAAGPDLAPLARGTDAPAPASAQPAERAPEALAGLIETAEPESAGAELARQRDVPPADLRAPRPSPDAPATDRELSRPASHRAQQHVASVLAGTFKADAPLELRLLDARAKGLRERRWDSWLRALPLAELDSLTLALWCEVQVDRFALTGELPPAWKRAVSILEHELGTAQDQPDRSRLLARALDRARAYGLTAGPVAEAAAPAQVDSAGELWTREWSDDLAAAGREAGLSDLGLWCDWVERGRS